MNNIICSPDVWLAKSASKFRRVKSVSEDAMFAATSSLKKLSKHLQLGMAIKVVTGSRNGVDILNRLGHCPSYSTIKELQLFTKYLRPTLVFMCNSALRGKFDLCFSSVFC